MKFIDLAPTIKRDHMTGPITGLDGETYTLQWLDDHPELTGRTITQSRLRELTDQYHSGAVYSFSHWLNELGIVEVRDTEPTNLQRLTQAIRDWEEGRGTDRILARHLNALGVKVPEADDE